MLMPFFGAAQEPKPITENEFRVNMFYVYMNDNGAISCYIEFENNDTLMKVYFRFKALSPKSDLKKGKYVYAPLYSYGMGRRRVQDDEGYAFVVAAYKPLGRVVGDWTRNKNFGNYIPVGRGFVVMQS